MKKKALPIIFLISLSFLLGAIPVKKAKADWLTYNITDNNDDVYVTQGGNLFVSGYYVHMADPEISLTSYLRWQSIAIGRGWKVDQVILSVFTLNEMSPNPSATVTIRGLDEVDTATFTEVSNLNTRPTTSALVNWNVSEVRGASQWHNVTITDLFREVQAKFNWAENNSFGVKILGAPIGGNDSRVFVDSNYARYGSEWSARLYIQHSEPTTPPSWMDDEYTDCTKEWNSSWNEDIDIWHIICNPQIENHTLQMEDTSWNPLQILLPMTMDQPFGDGLNIYIQDYYRYSDSDTIRDVTEDFTDLPPWDEHDPWSRITFNSSTITGVNVERQLDFANLNGDIDLGNDWNHTFRFKVYQIDTHGTPYAICGFAYTKYDWGWSELQSRGYRAQALIIQNIAGNNTHFNLQARVLHANSSANQQAFSTDFSIGVWYWVNVIKYDGTNDILWSVYSADPVGDYDVWLPVNSTDPTNPWIPTPYNCTDPDCLDDVLDIMFPDPEDPSPADWPEEGIGITRFRMRFFFLLAGLGCVFVPLWVFAYRRPDIHSVYVGCLVIVVGLAFLLAVQQI